MDTAKLFASGRSQAVRLPKAYRFEGEEVVVKRFGSGVLPFDAAAMHVCGPLRAELQRRGRPIGSLDTLIAAHALGLGATLVTNHLEEFSRVPGLVCENWA